MDARAKTIRDILYSRDQYLIPFFQRQYSWKREHWTRLWNDVLALLAEGPQSQHFMGPLVCTPFRLVPTEVAYQLIDGQQRLTTLTVLLVALRDIANERGESSVEEEINEDFLVHKREQGWRRLKILPRLGDREVLRSLIDGQPRKQFRRERLTRAYRFFRRTIERHLETLEETRPELRRLLSALTSQLSLVVITIDGENPYEIFESLNSTGLPLEESDLIRNFLFMQVPLEQQELFNEDHWRDFENFFDATDTRGAIDPTKFYRSYIMRGGDYSRRGATFSDFKRLYLAAGAGPEETVRALSRFAQYEAELRYPVTCDDDELRSELDTFVQLDLATAFPLLMALMDARDEGTLDNETLVGCLQDLASFALRRSICGESTRNYGRWFVAASKGVDSDARAKLRKEWFRRGWPDDAAFAKALQSFSLYRRERRKARMMLDALEQSHGHKEKVERAKLTIEHVMPQTIGDDADGDAWKKALGDDWSSIHRKLLHTLGNLTLTGYNPELSKRQFKKKQQILADSRLHLNERFTILATWNADQIRGRTDELAAELCKLWPRPEGPDYKRPQGVKSPGATRELSPDEWQDYWDAFRAAAVRAETGLPAIRIKKNGRGTWLRTGRRGVRFITACHPRRRRISVGLVGYGRFGKPVVEGIRPDRGEIEEAIGEELLWRGARLEIERAGVDFADKSDWKHQHGWLVGKLLPLIAATAPMIEADDLTFEDANDLESAEDDTETVPSLPYEEDVDEDEEEDDEEEDDED